MLPLSLAEQAAASVQLASGYVTRVDASGGFDVEGTPVRVMAGAVFTVEQSGKVTIISEPGALPVTSYGCGRDLRQGNKHDSWYPLQACGSHRRPHSRSCHHRQSFDRSKCSLYAGGPRPRLLPLADCGDKSQNGSSAHLQPEAGYKLLEAALERPVDEAGHPPPLLLKILRALGLALDRRVDYSICTGYGQIR